MPQPGASRRALALGKTSKLAGQFSRAGRAAFQRADVHARAEGGLVKVGGRDAVDDAILGRAAHARLERPVDLQLGVVHDGVSPQLGGLANAARRADGPGRREIHELGLGKRRRVLQRLDVHGGRVGHGGSGEKTARRLN
jgi:hypothetical protein